MVGHSHLKKKKKSSYISVIEKNFSILIFTAFPAFDKHLKQSGN